MREQHPWGCPLNLSVDSPPEEGTEGERRVVSGIPGYPKSHPFIEFSSGRWRMAPLSVTCHQVPDGQGHSCEALVKTAEEIGKIVERWLNG